MDLFRKKELGAEDNEKNSLKKCLTAWDLTLMGIGAIIGAGIFVLTGIVAATHAGPAIILCYIIAGCACGFAALSYAELAAMIGGCGSAYGYAYAGFGELIAWIVGWDLLLEYTLSVAAVAVGWSSYAADFLHSIKIHVPPTFLSSPAKGGWIDLPAVIIISLLTTLLMIGVRSTARVNGIMVAIKLSVIFLFIAIATFEVDVANWSPFFPFGWAGVIQGASLIFFAYIGFDAVSTAAEEAINPQCDLPIGIIGSLIVCTVLYIIVSALLTGIVHYSSLDLGSPMSNALLSLGFKLAAGVISIGAVAGLTTVMLVLFYGLTRILFAMARDGLLPAAMATTHPRFHTPSLVIALCGFFIASLAAFAPLDVLAELVNVGTLFAFIIVCSGVLYLRYKDPEYKRPFKTPGMPYVPILGIFSCLYLMINLPGITLIRFVTWMILGLILYWAYGYKYSHLALKSKKTQN